MSAIDYTPVLLAQLTDLQTRLTHQEATITALKAEVERLAGRSVLGAGPTMKSSVPLLPLASVKPANGPTAPRGGPRPPRGPPVSRDNSRGGNDATGSASAASANRRTRPQVAPTGDRPVRSLSDFLYVNDEVTIQVGTGKDAEGNFTHTTALATFDGTELTVTQCDLVSSLVGFKSAKPGEILYKFIDGLLEAGHIKRKFTIAPWKLCSVVRNEQKVTLDQLRDA